MVTEICLPSESSTIMDESSNNNLNDTSHAASSTTSTNPFIEIIEPPKDERLEDQLPESIDCYVITNIHPPSCGPLARELNALLPLRTAVTTTASNIQTQNGDPSGNILFSDVDSKRKFPQTDHLKRIRRRPATDDEIAERKEIEEEEQPKKENHCHETEQLCSNTDINLHGINEPNNLPAKRKSGDETRGENASKTNEVKNECDKPETSKTSFVRQLAKDKKKKKKNQISTPKTSSTWSLDLLIGSVEVVDDWINRSEKLDTSIENSNTAPQHEDKTTADQKCNTKITDQKITTIRETSLNSILAKYDLSTTHPKFQRRSLPGRRAETHEELDDWNKTRWPTLFFEKQTCKYKAEANALRLEEVDMMKRGLREAIRDAELGKRQWVEWNEARLLLSKENGIERELPFINGAVVMDPNTGTIVSRASEERRMQGTNTRFDECHDLDEKSVGLAHERNEGGRHGKNATASQWEMFPDEVNPLCTPVLMAVQGVSRKERIVACGYGMQSDEFKTGQYLCTGYDVYIAKEPNVFEAMALVHSRVRRVTFGIPDRGMGGLGGAASSSSVDGGVTGIHSLPGTNHHYRAFRFDTSRLQSGGEKIDEMETHLI